MRRAGLLRDPEVTVQGHRVDVDVKNDGDADVEEKYGFSA